MECLDDAALADLAGNDLSAQKRAEAMGHVEGCPSCDERLQVALFGWDVATADVVVGSEPAPDAVEVEKELPGTQLGRYLIIEQVGKGALGIVYAAYDPELDRRIAIKVLRQSVSDHDETLQDNLRREARSMAKLSHPNVVPVFDVGIAEGRLFIAMELIEGLTLREWAQREERSWRETRDVYYQAGQGLVAAHEAGLIYRDFKPSNVMIGNDGQVRVLDFGIAHAVFSPLAEAGGSVTGPTGGIGTPGYMAPEQYSADEKIDARADQYAFCVSLYEGLHGNRPFGGRTPETVRRTTFEQTWSEPERNPGLPAWLRGAIVRGLALDREERWPDMASLLHVLIKDKRSRRKQMAALLVAVTGTALVTSVATLMVSGELEPAERDRIEQLTIEARGAAAKSYYVYPPATEPDTQTAYTLVLKLEETEGDAQDPALDRAQELRQEFGSTLTRLGDRYYNKDGGKPFAMDYYAAAEIFVPGGEHAMARLSMTPGQLASFRTRAQDRSFSAAELDAADVLVALAEPDEQARNEQLVALSKRIDSQALNTSANLAKLLREVTPPVRGEGLLEPIGPNQSETAEDGAAEDGAAEDGAGEDGAAEDGAGGDDAAGDTPAPSGRSSQTDGGSPARDPAKAAALAKEARTAFSANRLEYAEKLYHRALEYDARNGAALTGLSELYFERGKYRRSLKFAKRAVARSPDQAKLRILLGDAHFKVLEYADARRHYDKARALGHPRAAKRLEKLEKTVGK